MRKKFFLISFFLIFLAFLLADFSFILSPAEGFAKELEIATTSYPIIPGAEAPVSTKTLLSDYIKYLFNFGIIISGLVAFGVMIYGGFRYLASAGSPSITSDAKDQIFSAFLGLIILLSSYLILTTLNPQLVILKFQAVPTEYGIIVYKDSGCPGAGNPEKTNLKSGVGYVKYGTSVQNLKFSAGSIYFYQGNNLLDVIVYPEEEWKGKETLIEVPAAPKCISKVGISKEDIQFGPAISNAKSIKLIWKIPGVYLCDKGEKNCKVYTNSSATLPKELNDKVAAIEFNNPEGGKYGAVLHTSDNFAWQSEVFLNDDLDISKGNNAITGQPHSVYQGTGNTGGVSSITVFYPSKEISGEGVTLYEDTDYKEGGKCYVWNPFGYPCKTWGLFKPATTTGPVEFPVKAGGKEVGKISGFTKIINGIPILIIPKFNSKDREWGKSIKIEGNYMAIVFQSDNYNYGAASVNTGSEVFTQSDPNLANNLIGKCYFSNMGCFGSLIVIPLK